ncbi:hypothetical protein E4U17_002998 [Claviceps sp. LM77 group G4]|nr:hypothetical protein E4U17_002998 [Claviceps sp. LM77 group G4]
MAPPTLSPLRTLQTEPTASRSPYLFSANCASDQLAWSSTAARLCSRIVLTTLVYYLCWSSFVLAIGPLWEAFGEAAEQIFLENASEEERQEYFEAVAQQEYLAFLPCPFATCEVKQPPYEISDPEWPALLALHEDQQAQTDIKCTEALNPSV